MTVTEDRQTRNQRIEEVVQATVEANRLMAEYIGDSQAELEEADDARDRIAELEIRVQELTEELHDVTVSRDSWAAQCAAHKRNIERLQNERDTANVAPRGGW